MVSIPKRTHFPEMRNVILSKTTGFRKHSRKIGGFTLIEVLLSTTLFGVAALSAMQSIDQLHGQKAKAEQARQFAQAIPKWQQEIRTLLAHSEETSGKKDLSWSTTTAVLEWTLLEHPGPLRLLKVHLVTTAPQVAEYQWVTALPPQP